MDCFTQLNSKSYIKMEKLGIVDGRTILTFLEYRFENVERELRSHSTMLEILNANMQIMIEQTSRCYGAVGNQECSRFQDSTGANPKEFTLKEMLVNSTIPTEESRIIAKPPSALAEDRGKNLKKQTPSFGTIESIVSSKADEPQEMTNLSSNTALRISENSADVSQINRIFSPNTNWCQTEKSKKELIIEPIDIEDQDPSKAGFCTVQCGSIASIVAQPPTTKSDFSGSRSGLGFPGSQESTKRGGEGKKKLATMRKSPISRDTAKKGIHSTGSRSRSTSRNKGILENSMNEKSPRQHKGKKHSNKKLRIQEQPKFVACSINNFFKLPKAHKPREGLTHLLSKKTQRPFPKLSYLESLPPRCLDLIADFSDGIIPSFVYCSKTLLHHYAAFKEEDYKARIKLEQEHCIELSQEMPKLDLNDHFKLSIRTRRDLENLGEAEWDTFCNLPNTALNAKDLMILQLYMAFLGRPVNLSRELFLVHLQEFIRINRRQITRALDPETLFNFSEKNLWGVRQLLTEMKEQVIDTNSASDLKILDVLASVIIDALQFANIIPQVQQAELDELYKEIEIFTKLKELMQRLLRIVLP